MVSNFDAKHVSTLVAVIFVLPLSDSGNVRAASDCLPGQECPFTTSSDKNPRDGKTQTKGLPKPK